MTKRMPTKLLGVAKASGNLANAISHQRLEPVRLSAATVWASEDPVTRSFVHRVSPPRTERSCEKRIERNRFLRCLGFARADNLQDDGASHADLVLLEVDVGPLESEQFAGPQTSNDLEQDHGSLADFEGTQ